MPEILPGFPACLLVCENSCHVQGVRGLSLRGEKRNPMNVFSRSLPVPDGVFAGWV